jgi:transposase
MARRGRRGYSEDFRREAVRLVDSDTKPIGQIARDLGINAETLRIWHKQAHGLRDQPKAVGGGGPAETVRSSRGVVASLEEENRRLKRENARLLEEREILKKATAFFAKDGR